MNRSLGNCREMTALVWGFGLLLSGIAHEGAHAPGSVNPSLELGEPQIRVTLEGGKRVVLSNGIPNHETGIFPNRRNPNAIAAQEYRFELPVDPQLASQPTDIRMNPFGISVYGVPFDPSAAEWWNDDRQSGWQYEPLSPAVDLGLDVNHAHVQRTGAYHYHGVPTALVEEYEQDEQREVMLLLGYAADGFPIYSQLGPSDAMDLESEPVKLRSSYRLKSGERQGAGAPPGEYDGTFVEDFEYVGGLGDLDDANGRTGATPEFPEGTYYYVITEEFPSIPRYFKGTPDQSFMRVPSGDGRGREGRPGRGLPEGERPRRTGR